ncbi:hypothetical protein IW150_002941, partial [Coemansia sp. RSA 2607]
MFDKSCFSAIEEDVSQPPEDTPSTSLENATKLNEIAVVVILDTLDDTLVMKLCDLSAYKIWKAMERMFNTETTCSLITKLRTLLLHSMSSDQDDPVEYWTSSMAKWSQFPNLELNLKEVAPLIVLGGLSPKYAPVRDKFASTELSKLDENSVLDAIKDLYSMQIESVKRNPASD